MDQHLQNLKRAEPSSLHYLWCKRRDGHALTDFEKIRLIHWLPDAEVKELFWKFSYFHDYLNSPYIAEVGYAWEIVLGEIIIRGINPIRLTETEEFSWSFHYRFFLETDYGNYVWNDPDYGGDNTITPFYGGLRDFCKWANVPFTRDKGYHIVGDYISETSGISGIRTFFMPLGPNDTLESINTPQQEKLDIKLIDVPIKVPGSCHPYSHLSKLVIKELI